MTFIYRLYPDRSGFTVKCLDWDCVFTQGETLPECRQNAIEITELFLGMLVKKELKNSQMPHFKRHLAFPYDFPLTFILPVGKFLDQSSLTNKTRIKRLSNLTTLYL